MSEGVDRVVSEFGEIVKPDGGKLSVLSCDGSLLRIRYTPGKNEECESCVLAPETLQLMITEALHDHAPEIESVRIETVVSA